MENQLKLIFYLICLSLIVMISSMKIESILCPDEQSYCPDGETCCQLSSGQYGCCPLPDAICCNDHLHCCPHGYSCDVEHSRCQKGFSINSTDVICPDGSMSCSDDETCCQISSTTSGCCPLRDAICCYDQIHCCPHGYQCDLQHDRCIQQNKEENDHLNENSMKIFFIENKITDDKYLIRSMNKISQSLNLIQCQDEKSICPEETTCCQMINGTFGCCPYSNGICCSDQKHCCPEQFLCDPNGFRCFHRLRTNEEKSSKEILWKNLQIEEEEEQICPDGLTKCSFNSTCCPNQFSTNYSCCHYQRGICCGSNGSLCCPEKYRCDEKTLSCQLNIQEEEEKNIYQQCEQSNEFCLEKETCCSSSSSKFNQTKHFCCPFQFGFCCDDNEHCCPSFHQCHSMTNDCWSI